MQYSFVYQALLEYYLYGDTELDVSSLEGHLHKLHNTFANGDRVGLEEEFKVRRHKLTPKLTKHLHLQEVSLRLESSRASSGTFWQRASCCPLATAALKALDRRCVSLMKHIQRENISHTTHFNQCYCAATTDGPPCEPHPPTTPW